MNTGEFFGWLHRGVERPAQELHARIAGSSPAQLILDSPPMGLGASNELPRGAMHVDARHAAVIRGRPHWRDPTLAATAAAHGHGAALVAAYTRSGRKLLDSLAGAFAFALFHRERRTLLCAIDPMGIESLCYAHNARCTVFARTVDSVAAHPDVGARLDLQSVYDYLYFHVVPSPQTIFADVRKLEPGHLLECADGRLRTEQYWHRPFAERANASEASLALELHTLLEQAVREQYVPAKTGAFLSGGIDSSTVAGLLSRLADEPARTFTIGFSAEGYDEMDYARITARHFQTRQCEYYLTPADVVAAVPRIAAHYDEPFGNSSAVPAYYCARLAHDNGIAHMLAGDGGDELFGGNSRYAKQNVFEWYFRCPAPLRRAVIEPTLRAEWSQSLSLLRKARSYIEQAHVPLPDRLQSYNYFSRTPAASILHPELLAAVDLGSPLQQLRAVYAGAGSQDAVNRMLYLDWKFTLADNDLRKVSRMCELAGVEVSYPWLHPQVVELSMRLPGHWKVRGQQLRWFVKRALRGFLPSAVINKPKHGFGLPFGLWMRNAPGLRDLAHDSLARLRQRQLVRPDYVDELERLHREEHAPYFGEFIWVLMMLEQWLEQHAAMQSRVAPATRDAAEAR